MKEKQTPESKIRDEANIAETLEDVLEDALERKRKDFGLACMCLFMRLQPTPVSELGELVEMLKKLPAVEMANGLATAAFLGVSDPSDGAGANV